MSTSESQPQTLAALGAATRAIIIFVAVLSIPLAAAETLELSAAQTSSWISAVYALPGLLSLPLIWRYRQPLLLTGNIFVVIFITRLGTGLSYPELIGAAIVAGALVLIVGVLRVTERLAGWIPSPIVFALLAGAVVPFVVDTFTQLGVAPVLVGGTVLVYLLSWGLLGGRVPAIFPALVVGLLLAALLGQFGEVPAPLTLHLTELTAPAFSLPAILTATPIFVILITLQANLPSIRFMQSHHYDPPELVIDVVSGIGTVAGSLLGPIGISLSLPTTSLIAGDEAGPRGMRHRAAYMGAGALAFIGLLAGVATGLAAVIPVPLLVALAGLALLNVLGSALERMTRGPVLLGAILTFAITLSEISLLGFGPVFWALVIGTAVALIFEREKVAPLQTGEVAGE